MQASTNPTTNPTTRTTAKDRATRAGRELARLLTGAGIGLAALVLFILTLVSVPTTVVAGAGLVLFPVAVAGTRRLADRQRAWFAAWSGRTLLSGYRPLPVGRLARVQTLITDPATWRDLAWLLAQSVVGLATACIGVALWAGAVQCLTAPLLRALLPKPTSFDPAVLEFTDRSPGLIWLTVLLGVGLVPLAYWVPRHLIKVQGRLAAALLTPSPARRLSARVDELTQTRASAVDSSAAELRRVERDLHDGAQMRLIAVTMNLGMAEDVIDRDPAVAKALLADARATAGEALGELRDLVRGIHPPVLADRGLDGAVRALALTVTSSVRIELDLRLRRRLAAAVESTVYFAIAESLTNAIRHSGAGQITVTVHDGGSSVRATIHDNGRGGADPARGSGLRGIERRLSTMDGSVRVVSPVGGGTTVDIEVPCAS